MNPEFEDLVGCECDFYGVDGQRFRLDDVTYEAVDYGDGSTAIVISGVQIEGLPVAHVIVQENIDTGTLEIIDLHDYHCWLEFGSAYDANDCLFPIFDYTPKGPADQ